jgi:hypothetical protein
LIPRDTFGNAVASAGVHVTFSPKINNGQTAVKTIDMTTWTEKTPNQSYSVTTGADGITAYFTMSGAAASNKSAVVVTATATQSPSSSTVLATASPCTLT